MKNTDLKKLAIGQCRVSKGDKAEIENSLKSQQAEILTLADKLGIKEEQIDWFVEKDARSSYQDRANWALFENKIEEACNNPNIAYFLSYSQERFCRNSKRSKLYKDMLRKAGLEVRFVTGDIADPNSDSGFMQEGMQELLAEGYSRKVASDTLRGCKQNAQTRDPETGYIYQNGGSAPFWLTPKKTVIGVNKYGEEITKTIWIENTAIHTAKIKGKDIAKTMWEWGKYLFIELRLKQGKSYSEIADFANEIKLPIARKSTFVRKNTLSIQAKNECIYGVSIYNKRYYNNNHKKGALKSESEWIVEENAMPALLTKEQYNLLQKISNKKARKVGSTSANKTNNKLLVNIPDKFYCANCGEKIISTGKHYVCSNYNSYGKKGCGASSFHVDSEWLDSKIEKEVIKLILDEKTIKALYEQYKNKYGVKVDICNNKVDKSVLVKALKQKEQEATNLLNAIASGNISGAALSATSNRLNDVSEEIRTIEAQIDNSNKQNQYRILTYDYFKQLCHNGSKLLTHSSLAEKRVFVERCIESVTLDPVTKAVNAKFNINPFWTSLENPKKTKKLEVSAFDTSSEMVAGAGFEPTTFGL